jgi:hypothetical protein
MGFHAHDIEAESDGDPVDAEPVTGPWWAPAISGGPRMTRLPSAAPMPLDAPVRPVFLWSM